MRCDCSVIGQNRLSKSANKLGKAQWLVRWTNKIFALSFISTGDETARERQVFSLCCDPN